MFQETCGEVSVPTVTIILPHRASSGMENVLRASDSRKSQGNDLWQNCTHTKRTASSHSQSSQVMRDTKTWRTIGVPVLGFGCLWSLQRRDLGKVLWMDNRPGGSRAAGSVLSDQVVVMPRHRASDDKHLLLVPWSLISFQLDSKGPIHLWHLDSVPRGVCMLFLSEPTRGNEDIIIFPLVSLHAFFPLLLFPAALWGGLTSVSSLVIRIPFVVLKELVSMVWLGVWGVESTFLFYCM